MNVLKCFVLAACLALSGGASAASTKGKVITLKSIVQKVVNKSQASSSTVRTPVLVALLVTTKIKLIEKFEDKFKPKPHGGWLPLPPYGCQAGGGWGCGCHASKH